ncbi:MAG TPA: CHASE2 domain-containing protein, partial [Myxococcota bacterium]
MITRRMRRLVGAPVGIAIGAVLGLLSTSNAFVGLEARTLDARFKVRGERPLDPRIVVVDVNDETLSLLGWPVPRGFYAQLIDTAVKHGARAVGFDVLFLEPSTAPMDALLVKAARDCKCAVFPSQLSPLPNGTYRVEPPLPELVAASASQAHVQLDNGLDGVFRSAPPSLSTSADDGHVFPALAVALARVAGAPVHLAGALDPPGSEALRAGERRAWINWRAASSSAVHALPLLDVLAAQQAI